MVTREITIDILNAHAIQHCCPWLKILCNSHPLSMGLGVFPQISFFYISVLIVWFSDKIELQQKLFY